MRRRNLLVIFITMALTLSFASQVLAQVPIEGWDKAKLGMSSGDVRYAYSEEEQYWERYAPINPIQERDLGLLGWREEIMSDFWQEKEENKLLQEPYRLVTANLIILGRQAEVTLDFIDNRLFRIVLSGYLSQRSGIPGLREAIEREKELLKEEGSFGYPTDEEQLTFLEEQSLSRSKSQWEKPPEERVFRFYQPKIDAVAVREFINWINQKYGGRFEPGPEDETYYWKDANDNLLSLSVRFWTQNRGWSFEVSYLSENLGNLWEQRRAGWSQDRERLTEREVESF